jgi:hypothetical protein
MHVHVTLHTGVTPQNNHAFKDHPQRKFVIIQFTVGSALYARFPSSGAREQLAQGFPSEHPSIRVECVYPQTQMNLRIPSIHIRDLERMAAPISQRRMTSRGIVEQTTSEGSQPIQHARHRVRGMPVFRPEIIRMPSLEKQTHPCPSL